MRNAEGLQLGNLKRRDHMGEKILIGSKKAEKQWTAFHELTSVIWVPIKRWPIFLSVCVTFCDLISATKHFFRLADWLTVHRSVTLVDFQLDAQNSYLFIYNIFIKIVYIFRALPCSSSGSLRRNCIYAASGIVTLCRWLSCEPVKKELWVLS